MNKLWKRFWSNPYRWGLWHWIGGRKWTWIMRDFAYLNPLLLIFIFFGLGMWLRPYVDWDDLWKFGAGLLIGHVLWGAKWKKGQGKQPFENEVDEEMRDETTRKV